MLQLGTNNTVSSSAEDWHKPKGSICMTASEPKSQMTYSTISYQYTFVAAQILSMHIPHIRRSPKKYMLSC
jgi:hypothetical protein